MTFWTGIALGLAVAVVFAGLKRLVGTAVTGGVVDADAAASLARIELEPYLAAILDVIEEQAENGERRVEIVDNVPHAVVDSLIDLGYSATRQAGTHQTIVIRW